MKTRLPHLISLLFIIFFYKISFSQAAPEGLSPQLFCSLEGITLEDLIVDGSNIVFWDAPLGNQLPITTPLVNGTTYYVTQGTATTAEILEILVNSEQIPAPIQDDFVDPFPCPEGDFTLNDVLVFNTDGFNGIFWFDENSTSGNQLPPNTILVNGTTYYAFQGIGDCAEGLAITILINGPIPAPIGESDQYFCSVENATLIDLSVFNTEGFNDIFWFGNTSEDPLPIDTPLVNGETYYASQGIGDCAEYLVVTPHIVEQTPAPTTPSEVYSFCEDGEERVIADIPVFNTDGFEGIFWFDENSTSGNQLPLTTILDSGTIYYAFQGIGSCTEGLAITIEIADQIPAPTGESDQEFCLEDDSTLADLAVFNTDGFNGIFWFAEDNASGDPLSPNTPIVDGTTYYAAQAIGCDCGCVLILAVTTHIDCAAANINDNELFNFELYPNPVKDILNIKINNNQTDINFTISDIQGRKISSNTLTIVDNTIKIDISNLDANVYFISLTDKRHTSTKRFVKK